MFELGTRVRERLIGTVVHVTDLHLFLNSEGRECHPDSARTLIRALHARGQKGLERHNNEAWAALRVRLPEIVAAERRRLGEDRPLLVVQTGDIEAYGGQAGPVPFPGYTAVQGSLWDELRRAGATACIDLFGNHDIWDGSLPLVCTRSASDVLNDLRRNHFADQHWPDRLVFGTAMDMQIEVYRVSTPALGRMMAQLAAGWISPFPYGPRRGRTSRVCTRLRGFAIEEPKALRIVLAHHPPHAFSASWLQRLSNCWVRGASRLAREANRLPIHLVLAGHRHALDPALDAARTKPLWQPPFSARTTQLVAESPTQAYLETSPGQRGRNSLSVYRLYASDGHFSLRRTVYESNDAQGPRLQDRFRASGSTSDELVVSRVRL